MWLAEQLTQIMGFEVKRFIFVNVTKYGLKSPKTTRTLHFQF